MVSSRQVVHQFNTLLLFILIDLYLSRYIFCNRFNFNSSSESMLLHSNCYFKIVKILHALNPRFLL